MNGVLIKAKLEIIKHLWTIDKENLGKARISWLCPLKTITTPAQINRRDLKIAWVNKWKNPHIFIIWEILNIIKPNCLKVDKAIIFLKSVSNIALKAEINIVSLEIEAIIKIIEELFKIT